VVAKSRSKQPLPRSKGKSGRTRQGRATSLVADRRNGASILPVELEALAATTVTHDVKPGSQTTWYYRGEPGAQVTIVLSRIANSGGHLHSGGPSGTANLSTFVLGPSYPQNRPVVFTAPAAAGTIQQDAYFSKGNPPVFPGMNRVHIPGLIALTGGVGITLTGSKPTHPQNHYGTPLLIAKIRQLASAFHAKFNKDLFVNDMSLPDGGLYDFNNTWAAPHKTHREGRTVDINSTSMSKVEKTFFQQKAKSLGFSVTLETKKPHWHLFI
jgi:Penicillin-insensitive murein endopeptidase